MEAAPPPLHDYLRDGMAAADLPDLHPLLAARDLLRAFSTLFHGAEENVMVRLLVLRTIGERGQAPDWTPQELRDQFAYLDAVKFDTVLARLRENGLLGWEAQSQRYRISPVGRQALAAIGMLLQFNREGDELAYVTAQLAAGQSMGRVGADDLQHLLSRLNELREDFDQAVLSGSEHRIQRAADTLQSVWQWVEKGTALIRDIAAESDLDAATHRVAQQIGRAQSALLRQASVFQRALNQLDRHRVHLGATGLSSSDVTRFLRAQDIDMLAALADGALARTVMPAFLLAPIALDVAEYELVEREREQAESLGLPPAQDAPHDVAAPAAQNEYAHAEHWLQQLSSLQEAAPLADWVPQDSFALSAYRLSLLGLLGDAGAENRNGVSASLAQLPMHWQVGTELEPVRRAGVAAMSRGRLQPGPAVSDPVTERSKPMASSASAERASKPGSKKAIPSNASNKTSLAPKKPGKTKPGKAASRKTTTRKTPTRKSGNA